MLQAAIGALCTAISCRYLAPVGLVVCSLEDSRAWQALRERLTRLRNPS